MEGGDEDKRHRRAGQGSVGHGLHFPLTELIKGTRDWLGSA